MYETFYHPGTVGGYHDYKCGGMNYYRYPRPIRREQRLLDATGIEIHTDRFVGESCFQRGPYCEPIPVKVEEKVKSFIIKAATECLEPCMYYTLHTNHPLPDGIFAEPTFIRVEKCGLFQDPVKLIYTETTFPMCEFDGHPKHCSPADPAFPDNGVDVVERDGDAPVALAERMEHDRNRHHETRLIPVELDLHGNTAFGDNFVKGISPHPKLLQLFYTNRGTFSLVRSWRRRTDY